MKTMLVHTLHHIQKYGSYSLEYYKSMLSDEQYNSYGAKHLKDLVFFDLISFDEGVDSEHHLLYKYGGVIYFLQIL